MDTSDSECFESADEEIYTDGSSDIGHLIKKCDETHLEKDVKILKSTHGTGEPKEDECIEKTNKPLDALSKIDENNPVICDKNSTESETQNKNLHIFENSLGNSTNQLKNEEDALSSDSSQSEPTQIKDCIILEEKPITNLTETRPVQINLDKNEEELQNLPDQLDLSRVKPEELNKHEKLIPNQELSVDSSDNEENMWANDEWEPIVDNNETNKPVVHNPNSNKGQHNVPEAAVDENMWDNDDWEPFEKIETEKSILKDEKQATETSWSGWGNWGVSSILNTATQGVSTLTNQVSQGISTVLETGMGIPDPKELARQDSIVERLENQESEQDSNNSSLRFGFGNLSNLVSGVSHITKFVENTGSKVITGGLDTLETIGKKTMEVLQEGDPGLKNKRALLKLDQEKPILSQILREAKEKAEKDNKELQELHSKKKLNYETLFDDYHGLVHLEALEMLSKQCEIKLQTLGENCSGSELTDFQETLDQIKELCELPDEDEDETSTFNDIKEKIQTAVTEMNVNISYNKLILTWEETESWLNNLKLEFCDETEIHQEALQVLAQLTAIAVEQFHKCGELLLIKEHRSTVDESDSLVQLTMAVTSLIGMVAGKFSDKLNTKSSQMGNKDSVNELITNVFFEAGNSSSYVQDAFQLLVPVLQVGAM